MHLSIYLASIITLILSLQINDCLLKTVSKSIQLNQYPYYQLLETNRRFHPHPYLNIKHTNFQNARPSVGSEDTTRLQYKRVCYFRMDPKTEIRLSQVDGNLCTHLILAFVRINSAGNIIMASETDESYLVEVPEFKRQYPSVKVMISVFNEPEHNGFPKAVLRLENRQRFARSAIDFLQFYHLDGIDLDWEFPNFPIYLRSREHERAGLTKILMALRSAFVENFFDRQVASQHQDEKESTNLHIARHSPVEPYVLTAAIAAQEAVMKASYELKQVASLCDWLNIMSYDYFLFKSYSPFTGPNSPLFPIFEQYVPIMSKLSHSWTVSKLLQEGVPREKIVMGIPTYARAYKLMFKHTHPAAMTAAIGAQGGRIEDYLDYREVCEYLKQPDTIVEFDARARVPYLITNNGYLWISYENTQSVREKVRHVINNNLGGYMTWNLNSDDFLGSASSILAASAADLTNLPPPQSPSTFPLHRAMLDEIRGKRRRVSLEDNLIDQHQHHHIINQANTHISDSKQQYNLVTKDTTP